MSDEHHSGLLYGLEQRIPPLPAFFSALQHVLAGLMGIITPPLIIGATLGLGEWLPYLISMSLLASGIGTFLQSNRVWGMGAGMICMQGTSFAFLGVTVAGGMWVKAQGGGPQDMMAMLFGVNFVAALVPVIVSRFIEPLKKIFTPIFPFGFQFNSAIFLPVALVSLVCILEAVGDLTANSLISQQSVDDRAFRNRLKGGILADGVSCMVAAMLCAFPNTTFAQNNGVIQMTGVASRYVGRYIGVILILLGLFPPVGELLRQIPAPVLGGATMVMFGCVVAAGIRIITQTPLSRRDVLIVGLAFGAGLGVESVPAFLSHFPPMVGDLFGSAATSGGLVAIALNLILPQEQAATKSLRSQDDRAESV